MRLTEKFRNNYWDKAEINYGQENTNQIVNKLGQLEDIEDELGIDLVTLFKLLNSDVCYELDCDEIKEVDVWGCERYGLSVTSKGYCYPECQHLLNYEEYGKTWALTKEELE